MPWRRAARTVQPRAVYGGCVMTELALSLKQPKAYLAGCLKGDAFMVAGRKDSIRGYIGLRVADQDFAEAFAASINSAYGLDVRPKPDERGYALVRTYNGYGRFDELRSMEPICPEAKAAWLRGLFDSEGNALCVRKPRGPFSWDRRVAMFSTNTGTLDAALNHLACLGIESRITKWNHSAGHKGTKQVFCLSVACGKVSYQTFADIVGSSIARKQRVLELLPTTYHPDISRRRREIQLIGAAVKHARWIERQERANGTS